MATTLEEIIKEDTLAIPDLLGLLTEGEDSYFPHAKVSPGADTRGLFIVSHFGGKSGDVLMLSSWTMYVYDDPGERYWRIEDVTERLRLYFNHRRLLPIEGSHTHYLRAFHRTTSRRLTDDIWKKNMMFVSFDVPAL